MPDDGLIGDLFSVKPKSQIKKREPPKREIKQASTTESKRTSRKTSTPKQKTKDELVSEGLNMVFDGIKKLDTTDKIEIINFAKKFL